MSKSSRHTKKKSSTTFSEPDYSLSSDSGTEMAASVRSPMAGSPLPPPPAPPYIPNYQQDGRVNRAYISSRTPSTSRYTVKTKEPLEAGVQSFYSIEMNRPYICKQVPTYIHTQECTLFVLLSLEVKYLCSGINSIRYIIQ